MSLFFLHNHPTLLVNLQALQGHVRERPQVLPRLHLLLPAVELVELGCAELCFDVKNELIKKAKGLLEKENLQFPPLFGDGNASGFIISEIDKHI